MDEEEYGDYSDADYASEDSGGAKTKHVDAEIMHMPNFVSKGSTFTVDKGTTINLPCYVDKLPGN